MDRSPTSPMPVARIAGGLVFDGALFTHADVSIENGRFASVARVDAGGAAPAPDASAAPGDPLVLDATGCYVIPGLVDVHFHGCMGADFSDATDEALHTIARYEASRGITAICPASMTFPTQILLDAFANAARFEQGGDEAALVGINMEGPYISPDKVGAQNPAYVRRASTDEFAALQDAAAGLVKIVDVAPETPGSLGFIDAVGADVAVSVAHTCADYDCASQAFEHGARHLTHLYNAMPPLHHRKPGPIVAGAEHDHVTAEIIADGVHIHPAMVRLAFKIYGDERIVLVSDTMRACGLEDGVYDLGGQAVHVSGPRATLEDGTLAGSVSDLLSCLTTAVQEMEIPLESAVRAATCNPARVIGIDGERGSIAPGKVADAVVLNQDLTLRCVVLRGNLLA